jgi:MinD-like ATPase involved in chromosome partitioning or flagellar assembly
MSIGILVDILYNTNMPKKVKKPTIPLPKVKKNLVEVARVRTTEEIKADKKRRFLEYFADVPVQKIGASYIGVSEDTIIDWKKADSNFANQIDFLQGEWIRKNIKEVKSREWLLERLFRQHFSERKEITGADGKDLLPRPIMGGETKNVSEDNNLPKNIEPEEKN